MPALLICLGVLIPLSYLLIRALEAELAVSLDLVFSRRNLTLLYNTLLLAGGVLVVNLIISLPLAWITTRTNLAWKKTLTLLSVLPLAIPGYVMAYALLGFTGANGALAQLAGIELPRISGYAGSLIAISLYTYPYLFLNLRAALLGLDPSLEEVSRSLGYRPAHVFLHVILPQLRPGLYAGSLIIGLYVLGDFGAVSLMRFETFSYAIYLQYAASYDRIYAAWLALMVLGITLAVLVMEYRLLRGLFFSRTGTGNERLAKPVSLGKWKWPALIFIVTLLTAAIILPVVTILHWMFQQPGSGVLGNLMQALRASVSVSAPAAMLTTALAIPIAYISVRYPSAVTRSLERVAYLGYATPPLALALALIFFTLSVTPYLYQTLTLLILAYTLHFLAEAVGPVRSALYQASPRLEEAARSLGYSRLKAFFISTFPLMKGGMIAAFAFVFLSAMKELPITFLLSPIGFETLALNVWSYSIEAMFSRAAPYALTILIFSSIFVGLLFAREWKRT